MIDQNRLDRGRKELENLLRQQRKARQVGGPSPGMLDERIRTKREAIRYMEAKIGSLGL